MKREGRQHGVVATACLPPCKCNNSLDQFQDGSSRRHRHMEPTAGIFIKVSQKPTNHSKYTSRCSRPRCPNCHTFPAGKAKDKTKGSQKARSSDVVTNYRLVTWRVADDEGQPGLKLSGSSASRILDHLDNCYDEGEEDQTYDDDDDDDEYDGSTHDDQPIELMINPNPRIEEIEEDSASVRGGDRDGLSYCNVGIVWEQVNAGGDENENGDEEEVEGWCLVHEF